MVLLKALNPFLSPIDRASFNGALEWQERVYKPLPADYALKHHLRMLMRKRSRIVSVLNHMLDVDTCTLHTKAAFHLYGELLDLYKNPLNFMMFMYFSGAKEETLANLEELSQEDDIFYTYTGITSDMKHNLIMECIKVRSLLEDVPFVRHIDIMAHPNIFAN